MLANGDTGCGGDVGEGAYRRAVTPKVAKAIAHPIVVKDVLDSSVGRGSERRAYFKAHHSRPFCEIDLYRMRSQPPRFALSVGRQLRRGGDAERNSNVISAVAGRQDVRHDTHRGVAELPMGAQFIATTRTPFSSWDRRIRTDSPGVFFTILNSSVSRRVVVKHPTPLVSPTRMRAPGCRHEHALS